MKCSAKVLLLHQNLIVVCCRTYQDVRCGPLLLYCLFI